MTIQQLKYLLMVANVSSINEAAKRLFISQPSLSAALKELEEEINLTIFTRSNRGVTITVEGEEFLGYARQVLNQVELLEDKYLEGLNIKKKFAVSSQHYSFAVKAFVEMVKSFDMNEYEFAIRETKTFDVINDVKNGKSEIGILYLNDFNEKILSKLIKEFGLEFHQLFQCRAYVYLWRGHPLAKNEIITMEELQDYPCLSFEQGENNSFYFAEEILSTYEYKRTIKACDRATMLNLMVGLYGYTLCSGIICEELNGGDFKAILLDSDEIMGIGYIKREYSSLSDIGSLYINEMEKYLESNGVSMVNNRHVDLTVE